MKTLVYRKYLLIIISIVVVSIQIQAQSGWTPITYLPSPRGCGTASVVDGKIYVIGGTYTGLVDADENEMYDPITDTWDTTLAPMPTPRGFLTSAVVNGIIYVIGGGFPVSTNKIEAYNPATNTWDTTLADMPGGPRLGMKADVVNGIIYVVGGNYYENYFSAYDPVTDTWDSTLAPMPRGGGALSVTAYNDSIYTFGGSGDSWVPFDYVFVYNLQTDTWNSKTNMPTSRHCLYTYLVDNTIYAVGGSQSYGSALATVEAYYPLTDSWESLPDMPNPYCMFAGAVVDNKIYVITGTYDWETSDSTVWEYVPIVGIEEEIIPPSNFILEQNYPNPFNPSTTISWQSPVGGHQTLKIYDVLGREIATLVDEYKPAGNYEVIFNSHSGLSGIKELPSEVYFYQLKVTDPKSSSEQGFIETKKMLLLK